MGQTPNHKCQICDTEYYACDSCTKSGKPRSVSCSPNCYSIYLALTESRLGIVDKEQSIKDFKNLGITTDTIDNYSVLAKSDEYSLVKLRDSIREQIKQMITIDKADEINNVIQEAVVKYNKKKKDIE